ncbi:MAG: UDP-N-acetylmuramoyl-tripeptide--D-alanyl-D-alanine ligase [Erysipelotrichaceae bacterium]|nr:UDP-N-acetylmuramoyl-tripeptide--D-alanyl-D-alanine ligase [Erysipelotrichaceae bacterium]
MLDALQIQWIWYSTVLISYIAVLVLSMQRVLWSFQQNRYKVDRYSQWLKQKIKCEAPSFFYYFLLSIPFLMMDYISQDQFQFLIYCFFTILYLFIMYFRNTRRDPLPLKWTARLVRLTIVMILIHACWIYLVLRYGRWALYGYGFLWCFVSSWFLVYIGWVCLYPLEWLIQWYYRQDAKRLLKDQKMPIVAITGSYGKTSCKYILDQLLNSRYYGLKTPKSYNTAMGIARTIRKQLKPFHEYFICEMGSDHIGEIETMMQFVQPKYGVVTTIGHQHLQTFGTMRNIIQEKMSLIEQLPRDGIGFLNQDNLYIREYELQNTCQIIGFSHQHPSDYQLVRYEDSDKGTKFTIRIHQKEEYEFETLLYGKNHLMNLTAMIAVAHTLGMSMEELQKNVKKIEAIEHRLEKKEIQGRICFDNSYSSNLESAKESMELLAKQANKRVLITPGLVDLDQKQEEMNFEFGCHIKDCADVVCFVGEHQTQSIQAGLLQSGFPSENIFVVNSMAEALQKSLELTTVGDCILIENDLPKVYQDQRDR